RDMGRWGGLFRVDGDTLAVEGCPRVHRRKGALAMAVEARRRIGGDHISEGAAVFGLLAGYCRCCKKRRRKRRCHYCCSRGVRPSRRALRALLTMRCSFHSIEKIPHPEVPREARPRRTHSVRPARFRFVKSWPYLSSHIVAKSWLR